MKKQEIKKAIEEIETVISNHERLSHSYFWHSNKNASGRRYAEKKNNHEYRNEALGISIKNSYTESCNHVYYRGIFYIDGKKVTVRELKKLVKALSEKIG